MSLYYDVDVYRFEENGEVWWGAEAGLEDDLSLGLEQESTKDVSALFAQIYDDVIELHEKWPGLRVRFFEGRGEPATASLVAI